MVTQTMFNDKRKKSILEFVFDHPGTSLRNIIDALDDIAAPATISARINELVKDNMLEVKKGARRGQKSQHSLTEKGRDIVNSLIPRTRVAKGIVKIGFSEQFIENIGREDADRFLTIVNDPKEGKKLTNLISKQITLYVRDLKSPSFSIEYVESLKRHFFVGSLPKEESESIRKSVEQGDFRNEIEAFKFILVHAGLRAFRSFLKAGGTATDERFFITLMATKHDQEKGYVSARREFKKWIQRTPPKKVREALLRIIRYS